jgi:hypothetical protein
VDKVARRTGRGGLKEKFQHKQSDGALQIFTQLNLLILDVRKVLSSTLEVFDIDVPSKAFEANIQAIQKLVQEHTEHPALPMSCSFSENANIISVSIRHLHQSPCITLSRLIHPRLFIQEIEDKLFPTVPSLDDYSCAICTNVAFKPIRLSCMHLFCARCLVKMQRRGEGNCPMCRAPSVLEANARTFLYFLSTPDTPC